ncbi:ABC transporter ATP-binding protein [Oscillatoria sp. FACHB-1406]|uniref:ABC transporter ATP-binding protein n=1 Tax=Oscillatoria sp. FACHB-1406 TaxID=2692846 RepID=UPI00168A05BD|nr:ABC transporter ATP-binding protein [Oscillatoria sp. FACHB-1406]MBD2576520.1 ABC transporter ATP-binding protein [Oscillatoria sp. FACHB-1406]
MVSPVPKPEKNNQLEPAVQTWELGKVYRTGFWMNQKVESLKNCSLTVYRGETFGLLGPNGAGKTTLFKVLLGIIRRSGGRATILGQPIGDRAVKHRLGYLPENAYFYDYLTGWEFLSFVAGLFEIPRSIQRQRIPQLLDLVGLSEATAKKKQLRQYSKGMLQRIGMAQALINNPELVFLDEPMSGLDPMGRYRIRQIILALQEEGKTIFFNSHILSDVEQICDRVAILANGELIGSGTLDELLGTTEAFQVVGKGGNEEILRRWVANLEFKYDGWHGQLTGDAQEFIATLRLMNGELLSMTRDRVSLEDFFIQQLRDRGMDVSR